MEVILEGQEALLRALGKVHKDVLQYAQEGLVDAGMRIVADAQYNLRKERNNTTGRLSNSGSVKVQKNGSVVAGFMKEKLGQQENYAEFLETGTRPHWVSIKWLLPWVKKKMFYKGSAGRSAARFAGVKVGTLMTSTAYAIQHSIAKHGTKAHPFFAPAVKKNERVVLNTIQNAILKAMRMNTR